MGILSGDPRQEPMHYGEVTGLWSFLAGAQTALAVYETYLNHAGDKDLKKLLDDKMHNVIKPEIEDITTLLKENGVALPPAPAGKPVADRESIPEGARLTDKEIADLLSADLAAGLLACSKMMSTAIREDISAMFAQFHARKAQYGLMVLRLMKGKGWLMTPPLHKIKSEN